MAYSHVLSFLLQKGRQIANRTFKVVQTSVPSTPISTHCKGRRMPSISLSFCVFPPQAPKIKQTIKASFLGAPESWGYFQSSPGVSLGRKHFCLRWTTLIISFGMKSSSSLGLLHFPFLGFLQHPSLVGGYNGWAPLP